MSDVIVKIPTDQAAGVAAVLAGERDSLYNLPRDVQDAMALMAVQIRNTLTDRNLPHD